ncbi:MAG: TIGR03619 family F420-dependent LLM class oxidoreductase [Pseudomonadota bacterium]
MKKTAEGLKVGVFTILADMSSGDPAVVAKRAEELGFYSYWVPEHAVIPEGSADDYPGRPPGGDVPAYLFKIPDPLIALARASATTSTIELGTGIALVPERPALLGAAEIASLDHYSGGRFLYGIGAGWNEPECTVLGGDFDHRWTQTKEYIMAMKACWTGEYVEHHGKYVDFDRLIVQPAPARKPHPPILLGSIGSPRVYKRCAQWGDGWLPFVMDPQEIADGRAEIDKYCKELGRDPKEVEIIAFAANGCFRKKDELKALADAGADGVVLWCEKNTEADTLAELEAIAGDAF